MHEFKPVNFKPGDKVRVIKVGSKDPVGTIVTVSRIFSSNEHFCTEDSPTYIRVSEFYKLVERKKENKMEYKIGKKYRSSWNDKDVIWTCAWVQKNIGRAVFENELDVIIAYPEDTFWEEVKEKITVTKYAHWFWSVAQQPNPVMIVTSESSPDFTHGLKKENYIKTDTITCEMEKR